MTRTALVLGLLLELGLIATVLGRILETPVNHVGVSPYLGLLLALPCAALGFRNAGKEGVIARALLALSLLVIILLFVLDQSNILVEYETWLKRGMPERPF